MGIHFSQYITPSTPLAFSAPNGAQSLTGTLNNGVCHPMDLFVMVRTRPDIEEPGRPLWDEILPTPSSPVHPIRRLPDIGQIRREQQRRDDQRSWDQPAQEMPTPPPVQPDIDAPHPVNPWPTYREITERPGGVDILDIPKN